MAFRPASEGLIASDDDLTTARGLYRQAVASNPDCIPGPISTVAGGIAKWSKAILPAGRRPLVGRTDRFRRGQRIYLATHIDGAGRFSAAGP